MGAETKIEWCTHTASPWYGCSRVHAGCEHCYAETLSKRNPKALGVWGEGGVRVKSKSFVANMHKWQREAEKSDTVVSVFPSLCDPFEDRPELVEWRREMFAVSDECPNVRLLLLTKRPENILRMWLSPYCDHTDASGGPLSDAWHGRPNVWLGTSISDQATADKFVPELLRCRDMSPVLFLSAEPLLGEINLRRFFAHSIRCSSYRGSEIGFDPEAPCNCGQPQIKWVIVGGESGPHARPCNIEWIRSIRDQCKAADVPCFIKQIGANIASKQVRVQVAVDDFIELPEVDPRLGDKKGGDWDEWPEDLRVREMPEVAT